MKVRIACVVVLSTDGGLEYNAVGWDGATDPEMMAQAEDPFAGEARSVARCWITAEVPEPPGVVEVEGEVQP